MNRAEAARILAQVSARDGREVGEAAVLAWANDLWDVEFNDAQNALREYYRSATRNTRNWIYPGDVLVLVVESQVQAIQHCQRKADERTLAQYRKGNGADVDIPAGPAQSVESARAENPLGALELDRRETEATRKSPRQSGGGW